MRILLAGIALSFFCGCATTPVPINEAKQAPADRVLAFLAPTAENTAILTVIRDEGITGSACFWGLYINKILAARLDVAEVARFYVQPGEVLLRIGGDPQGKGLCALGQDNWTQRETILKPGEQKIFRLFLGQDGKWDIFRSDTERNGVGIAK